MDTVEGDTYNILNIYNTYYIFNTNMKIKTGMTE